jgi:hypothetical protein
MKLGLLLAVRSDVDGCGSLLLVLLPTWCARNGCSAALYLRILVVVFACLGSHEAKCL